MPNNKNIDKIKKLLRLAKSANEHEAAAAMSRAQALMQQMGLSSESPELSDVSQSDVASKFKAKKPASYFSYLANTVAEAFGCHLHFRYESFTKSCHVVFTGHNERPEVAKYAHEVLERQLVKARQDYIATLNKRIKSSTKTARADLFCEGWVVSVSHLVKEFALSESESNQIDEYIKQKHPNLSASKGRSASVKNARGGSDGAYFSGIVTGRSAQLSHGVQGSEQAKLANLT
ncbi:DUF2786 domain-containing protein [Vibrio scophthalmi]|uniref:DUF2786 domain-containing protein n=1 Tax=Vibrio scophthalmi TaxID=45658 RepID=UPI00349F41B4